MDTITFFTNSLACMRQQKWEKWTKLNQHEHKRTLHYISTNHMNRTYIIIHKQHAINIPISPQPCKQSIATSSGSKKPKDQSENQKPKKPGQSPTIDLPLRSIATDHINWKKLKQKKNGWFCGYFGFCCFDEAKATTSFHKFCPSGVKFLKAREDIQEKSWNPGNETSSEALGHTGSPKAQPVNSLPCRTILGRYQYSITSVKICFSSTCSCWDVGHNASP